VEQLTTSTGLSPSEAWSVATDQSAWRALRPVDGQALRERVRDMVRLALAASWLGNQLTVNATPSTVALSLLLNAFLLTS